MRASELIAILQEYADTDDPEVFFSHPTGDYWCHTVAKEINEVEIGAIRKNAYLGGYEVVPDYQNSASEQKEVLIIS